MRNREQGTIGISSPMVEAWKNGCTGYVPSVEGVDLAVEMSDPMTSFDNLNKLIDSGLNVATMQVGPAGNVLVVFQTGETYLATGFSLDDAGTGGGNSPKKWLARFCNQVWGLGVDRWMLTFHHYEHDSAKGNGERKPFRGSIDPSCVMPSKNGIFSDEEDS